jgi:hypothetical protein
MVFFAGRDNATVLSMTVSKAFIRTSPAYTPAQTETRLTRSARVAWRREFLKSVEHSFSWRAGLSD